MVRSLSAAALSSRIRGPLRTTATLPAPACVRLRYAVLRSPDRQCPRAGRFAGRRAVRAPQRGPSAPSPGAVPSPAGTDPFGPYQPLLLHVVRLFAMQAHVALGFASRFSTSRMDSRSDSSRDSPSERLTSASERRAAEQPHLFLHRPIRSRRCAYSLSIRSISSSRRRVFRVLYCSAFRAWRSSEVTASALRSRCR